jgi:hypothetical protein
MATRKRNKQITLDILTGLSATEAGKKYGITHQSASRVLISVIKEAGRSTEYVIPYLVNSVKSAKSMSDRLIPIVHNHYKTS